MIIRGRIIRYRVKAASGLPHEISGVASGQIITNAELVGMHWKRYENRRTAYKNISKITKAACENGLLEEYGDDGWDETLPSIVTWLRDMERTTYANQKNSRGTRSVYGRILRSFNCWLRGKKFNVTTYEDRDGVLKRRREEQEFENVEQVLKLLEEFQSAGRDVQRIIKEYLRDPMHNGKKASSMALEKAAIMSYFKLNDCPIILNYDSKKYHDAEVPERRLSLSEITKMIYSASTRDRAILLCGFHRGLDASTMAEKFNYEAFGQLVKYFSTRDWEKWDVAKCPVPIVLTRVKTRYRHTGFLDVDAVQAVKAHLRHRKDATGRDIMPDEPMFTTTTHKPLCANTIAERFTNAGRKAGVLLKNIEWNFGPHEMRDLLKSTLINSGCRMDIADHVIGHKPKDSYEKQTLLYPDTVRSEYAKASDMLNIITKSTRHINQRENVGVITVPSRGDGEVRAGIRPTGTTTACLDTGTKALMEFICAKCSLIHTGKVCPECGSEYRRIWTEGAN